MRKLITAFVLAAALTVVGSASATKNEARVLYNGNVCGDCNFVVQQDGGSPVAVATGGNNVECHDYIEPVGYTVHLGNPCYNENAYRNDGCSAVLNWDNPCSVRAWARRPCAGGGYHFSATKGGHEIYSGYGELIWTFWGNLPISSTSPCYAQNPNL